MKTNKLIYFLLAGLLVAGLSSCNDFLDEQPDNRTIIDSEEKAIKMLVSAYADSQPWLFLEMASDNTDNHGANYDGWSRFWQESYEWSDPTETDNHGKPGGNTGTENKSWILPTVVASASVFVGGGLTALIIALVKKKKSDGCIPGNPGSTDGTE